MIKARVSCENRRFLWSLRNLKIMIYEAGIKIIVLYKDVKVSKDKCPEIVRNIGIHIPMIYIVLDGKRYWDYDAVRKALEV